MRRACDADKMGELMGLADEPDGEDEATAPVMG